MLTRLKIRGFKSLLDVDVKFGAFTCIAGLNATGKSNLFDAIRFLSDLASLSIVEAGSRVRGGNGRSYELDSLFTRIGTESVDLIELCAEFICPAKAQDELGIEAEASSTYLQYKVVIRKGTDPHGQSLQLESEDLSYVKQDDAARRLGWKNVEREWLKKYVYNRRRSAPYIETREGGVIHRTQDGSKGRSLTTQAKLTPRTVLSVCNASESPTAVCARREMQSWKLLQLEPAALREPSELGVPGILDERGLNLPAYLDRIDRNYPGAFQRVGNRLSNLIEHSPGIAVQRDDRRDILVLFANEKNGQPFTARSLSDGTLRFVALSAVAEDYDLGGTLCIEEPENGIHPQRIGPMLDLLASIASVPTEEPEPLERLRQVIISTHSPVLVNMVGLGELVYCEGYTRRYHDQYGRVSTFKAIADTWRTEGSRSNREVVLKRQILDYLRLPTGRSETNTIRSKYANEARQGVLFEE